LALLPSAFFSTTAVSDAEFVPLQDGPFCLAWFSSSTSGHISIKSLFSCIYVCKAIERFFLPSIYRDYTRASILANADHKIDIHSSDYPSRVWLYIFCGLLDSMWQTTAYWLMGAMSNDPAKLAYLTGFCMFTFLEPPFNESRLDIHLHFHRQVNPVRRWCWCLAR
jgi:hypothetical protein